MRIRIKYGSDEYLIETERDEKVSSVKDIVSQQISLPSSLYRLVFNNKLMVESKTLKDHGISDNSRLFVLAKNINQIDRSISEVAVKPISNNPKREIQNEITNDQILSLYGKTRNSEMDSLLENPEVKKGLSLIKAGIELYGGIDKYKSYLLTKSSQRERVFSQPSYGPQLKILHEAGFHDDAANINALIECFGDTNTAINKLRENQKKK